MIYTEEQLKEMAPGINCSETPLRPRTTAEQIIYDASERAYRAEVDGGKAKAALLFYGDHPEFAEFIGLIRSGAIQI